MSKKFLYSLARPLLFSMDAEAAHHFTLPALKRAAALGLTRLAGKPAADPRTVMGITFPNPVGLAAGLDKDGAYIDALADMGFGSIEVGTVTPRAQAGNPKPRMFRLPEQQAIINRLGFNNEGVDALVRNVERARRKGGLLGINIGKNKDTPNESAEDDYLHCLRKVYGLADYVTVNISSPNTAGLRELQEEQALRRLVSVLRDEQEALASHHGRRVPMLVKIAPDLSENDIDAAGRVLGDLSVDGVIASNTTIARDGVEGARFADEVGGLSGAPLMGKSTAVLRMLRTRLPESIPLIGVGGISSPEEAWQKLRAGASAIQIYSAMIYQGLSVASEIARAIDDRLARESMTLTELTGSGNADWI